MTIVSTRYPKEPQIIWEDDDLGVLYVVYEHDTCYAVHIVFDLFPFDDLAVATEMLSPFATINDMPDGVEVIFVDDVSDEIEELTEQTACVIIELAKYQDEWLYMSPIERLELYGKVLEDA